MTKETSFVDYSLDAIVEIDECPENINGRQIVEKFKRSGKSSKDVIDAM